MRLQIVRLRLWRLVRYKFLSVQELALLTDLTIGEMRMVMEVSKEAGKIQ